MSFNFTTGLSPLPDIGVLSYNGCIFSPLFESNVSGKVVQDNAGRTTKLMEYTITVDGYATLPVDGGLAGAAASLVTVMTALRRLLTAQAGVLIYTGRGNDIIVNLPGGTVRDVAWGPIPEILDFQPLGAGRSAKIKWQVKTRIPEVPSVNGVNGLILPILQFNEETGVTYDDAGFSTLSIRGTLEIALTRLTQSTRTLTQTVDDFRQRFMTLVGNSIDLKRFRVTRREFHVSRDKRTMEWDFAAEELPYMRMPPDVTVARGNYSVKPSKAGVGLCNWVCTLRATYTVRKDKARRTAWLAFLALLRLRMKSSQQGTDPDGDQNPGPAAIQAQQARAQAGAQAGANILANILPLSWLPLILGANQAVQQSVAPAVEQRRAWLIDFSIDEGVYLDSKTVTFTASWRLITTFASILVASGLWRKLPEGNGNLWATSIRNISGWTSWTENRLDASQDVIVDFGGGG